VFRCYLRPVKKRKNLKFVWEGRGGRNRATDREGRGGRGKSNPRKIFFKKKLRLP
jgi:hypothetical protein